MPVAPRWMFARKSPACATRFIAATTRPPSITHATHWIRKEKIRNAVTGALEDPDEEMMVKVEQSLDVGNKGGDFRREVISRIGAWSIDNPQQKPDYPSIFAREFTKLRGAYFEASRMVVKKTIEDILIVLAENGEAIRGAEERERALTAVSRLQKERGYCLSCMREAVSFLHRHHYAQVG